MLSLVLAALTGSPAPAIRVDGEGYFRLSQEGRTVFARRITLQVIGGKLGGDGATFLPAISCSGDVSRIQVDLEGNVTQEGQPIGRLVLGVFGSSSPQARGAFYIAQDRPRLVNPGDDAAGVIRFESGSGASVAPKKPVVNSEPTPIKADPLPEKTNLPDVLVPEPPINGIGVGFRSDVTIAAEEFTIGDVAEIKGNPNLAEQVKRIVLGQTPVIGAPRTLDSARILAKLRAANIDLRLVRIGVVNVKVSRAGQNATDEEFIQAAVTAAETRFGKYGDLIARQQQPDMSLPRGEKKFVVDDIDPSRDGYRALVSVWVDGKCINRRVITLDRANAPTPPRMGESVKVRVCANNLRLETSGRITRVGKPGEQVEVTTVSGAKLTGTLIGPGLVEVR